VWAFIVDDLEEDSMEVEEKERDDPLIRMAQSA
jgi:hypothetical protein